MTMKVFMGICVMMVTKLGKGVKLMFWFDSIPVAHLFDKS